LPILLSKTGSPHHRLKAVACPPCWAGRLAGLLHPRRPLVFWAVEDFQSSRPRRAQLVYGLNDLRVVCGPKHSTTPPLKGGGMFAVSTLRPAPCAFVVGPLRHVPCALCLRFVRPSLLPVPCTLSPSLHPRRRPAGRCGKEDRALMALRSSDCTLHSAPCYPLSPALPI
jgi:hypothetical protein